MIKQTSWIPLIILLISCGSTCMDFPGKLIYRHIPDSPGGHLVYYTAFINQDHGITVGGHGTTYWISEKTGNKWEKSDNRAMCLWGIDIVDENTAWTGGNGKFVCVTKDGGKTWKNAEYFGADEPNHCRFFSFLDDKTGWIASPRKLGLTTDGGHSWKQLVLPEKKMKLSAIYLKDPKTGYLLDDYTGTLYITNDSGKTWVNKNLGTATGQWYSQWSPTAVIRFSTPQKGFVIFNSLNPDDLDVWYILQTSDGGNTWKKSVKKTNFGYIYMSGDLVTITEPLGEISLYRLKKDLLDTH